MDDTSTLTSNFTASGSGTFRTASSGQRVEISSTHGPEVRFFNSSGADVGALNQSVSLLQLRTGAVAGNNMQLAAYGNMNIASAGSDGINFSSSVAGNGKPEIRIGGAAATNKYLIANSDGKLDYSILPITNVNNDNLVEINQNMTEEILDQYGLKEYIVNIIMNNIIKKTL